MRLSTRRRPAPVSRSAFAGFRFPAEVITVAVRWYLRYGLSYRDVEELLAERGVEVDHVTVYRWVQRFTPLFADAARFARHSPGDRWFVDETYVKVNGVWRYVYRAVDQHGQVIDVLVSKRRDGEAARRFFQPGVDHAEGDTDRGRHRRRTGLPRVLDELVPGSLAPRRAVRKQPDRSRPQPPQTPAATHARPTHRPHRASHHHRIRVHAEPSPRPLRTRHRDGPPATESPPRSPNSHQRSETQTHHASLCLTSGLRNSASNNRRHPATATPWPTATTRSFSLSTTDDDQAVTALTPALDQVPLPY